METCQNGVRKAYAKLHGTFDAIEGGWVNDGLVDLTGPQVDQAP